MKICKEKLIKGEKILSQSATGIPCVKLQVLPKTCHQPTTKHIDCLPTPTLDYISAFRSPTYFIPHLCCLPIPTLCYTTALRSPAYLISPGHQPHLNLLTLLLLQISSTLHAHQPAHQTTGQPTHPPIS
ncbi:hypothetical protein E2C01_029318 [Portunus trituberculatus]|uniref:Uncharacterized protein n=1 Tax=Portunus trituberculatus TaxID=210409 RepID=A0A5B7EN57_PORTR|nr:hypothetical protein [Portunus trituberculatus]